MNPKSTVYIVDDDFEVRQSWELILQADGLTTQSFASAEEFLDHIDLQSLGCLILDLRMPGMGGLRLLETLRQKDSPLPVIVISAHADVPTAVRSMKLGLSDFLTKPVDPAALIVRIRELLQNDAATRQRLQHETTIKIALASLSERELEVLRLVLQGKLHKQIATHLGISTRTVDHHRAQINLKLKANNLADLMRIGFISGLI